LWEATATDRPGHLVASNRSLTSDSRRSGSETSLLWVCAHAQSARSNRDGSSDLCIISLINSGEMASLTPSRPVLTTKQERTPEVIDDKTDVPILVRDVGVSAASEDADQQQSCIVSYLSPEMQVRKDQPLRPI
jgi:hypothetical protein